MEKGTIIGFAVAAAIATGLTSCSSDKSENSSTSEASGGPKIVIDGQTQKVEGPVSCTQVNGNLSIGIGDPSTGVGTVVSNADPPVVQAVGLGNLTGVTYGYSAGAPNQGSAQATKNGKSYIVKGTVTGVDAAKPDQPLSKPFEIDVTCP